MVISNLIQFFSDSLLKSGETGLASPQEPLLNFIYNQIIKIDVTGLTWTPDRDVLTPSEIMEG